MTASQSTLESLKTIEVKSDVIDKYITGWRANKSDDGKRYHLFVKVYRGNGTQQAAGIEFKEKEDALNAQKLLHSVLNEVLA